MKQRNSSIELLRIIAMILIVFHHFSVHGIYLGYAQHTPSFNNHLLASLLSSGGKLGVDLFMIISGYFMVKTTFKRSKFNQLLTQMWFYAILFYIINLWTHWTPINIKSILSALLPFTYTEYWFMTAYLVVYLLSPFINHLLSSLSKANFQKLLVIIGGLVFVLPTFLPKSMEMMDNGIIITLSCYLFGAYIRLYPITPSIMKKWGYYLTIISSVTIIGSIIIFTILAYQTHISTIMSHITFLAGSNSIFILLLSIGLCIIAITAKPFYNKTINLIAGTTLGIYLIHDNPIVRHGLWQNILKTNHFYQMNGLQLLISAIIICTAVFLCCSIIEWIRQQLFKSIHLIFNH